MFQESAYKPLKVQECRVSFLWSLLVGKCGKKWRLFILLGLVGTGRGSLWLFFGV
jgi:hypothetical protein